MLFAPLLLAHWIYMMLMVTNRCCNRYWSDTRVSTAIPALAQAFPESADMSMAAFFCLSCGIAIAVQLLSSVVNTLRALGLSNFMSDAVSGLLPLFQWFIAVYLTYQTEWGVHHLAYSILLLCPSFCLINSKLIVCNFTKMETEMNAYEILLFALFPLNAKCK